MTNIQSGIDHEAFERESEVLIAIIAEQDPEAGEMLRAVLRVAVLIVEHRIELLNSLTAAGHSEIASKVMAALFAVNIGMPN